MIKKRHRDSYIFEKDLRGHYVEPPWVSQRLFQVEGFNPEVIYDPACGWGRITTSARAAGYKVHGSDIKDYRRHQLLTFFKADFLKTKKNLGSIVCNPPFDHLQEFCEKAIDIGAKKVCMIALLRILPAAHWLADLPLARIHLLTPRPSMPTGDFIRAVERGERDPKTKQPYKIAGGQQDFVWLVFDRKHRGDPDMRWLHRNA